MKRFINVSGILFCLFFQSCNIDEPEPTIEPATGKLVLEKSVSLASSNFYKGKTISVGTVGEELGLNGLELKQNSEGNRTAQIEISASKISSHTFGNRISPITPLISIKATNEKLEEEGLYLLKIPLSKSISSDEFAMAFYYDESTGKLEGIPMVKYSSSSITIATRHFSSMFVSVIKKSELPDNISSGFNPNVDGWPFPNYGTAYHFGICAGMSTTAMYAYLNQGGNLVKNADNEGNTDFKTPNIWQDDSYGIIYSNFGQDEYSRIFDSWKSDIWLLGIEDELTYRAFAYSMMVTGEPQFVRIDADSSAHAMVVYAIREKQLMVYDPNYPKNTERLINFKGSTTMTFEPYNSAENATQLTSGKHVLYPYITYAAKTAVIDWNRLGQGWVFYKDRSLHAAAYGSKGLKLNIRNSNDSLIASTYENTSVIFSKIKLTYSTPNNNENIDGYLIDKDGKYISSTYTLKKGDNYLGLYLTSPKGDDGGWFGFKWFKVRLSDYDENLIGKWEFYRAETKETFYWQFNSDGTCVQFFSGKKYDWKWTNENGQLKLFVDNGKPAYMTYKIIGNELYFWVDSMSIWGSPFVKV